MSYVVSSSKLNTTGMRWVSEPADFNFQVKYRPGKSSQTCDYLSQNPVEDKFWSHTKEMDLGNFKMFVNSILNVQNNWLTVTAKQPEISETYLNLKPEKELMKIYCETLSNLATELLHLFLKLFHHKTDPVLKIKN